MSFLSKVWILLVFNSGFFLFSTSAAAYTCTTTTQVTTLQIPNMVVPIDAAIGSKIGSSVSTGSVQSFNCTNESPMMVWQKMGAKGYGAIGTIIGGNYVYLLGRSGIGYTVKVTTLSACNGTSGYMNSYSGTANGDANSNLLCGTGSGMLPQPMTSSITIDFYKTGDIKPGKVASQQMAAFVVKMGNYWQTPESIVQGSEFRVLSPGCSVTNTSINIPMGIVKSSSFNGVGSVAGEQGFSIPLNCEAGVKVGLVVSAGGAGAWKENNGLINLDSSSSSATATGIKLQLLRSGVPIKLGVEGNVIFNSIQGPIDIPLSARYYQSAVPITAGSANATATFTMKYE